MLYARDKQKIRKLLDQWKTSEEIIASFPIKKIQKHEIHTLKTNRKCNQYHIVNWKIEYWHCKSCDSWKKYTKEFFQSNGKKLSSTCKHCRNLRKRNLSIIRGTASNKFSCKKYYYKCKIKWILDQQKMNGSWN